MRHAPVSGCAWRVTKHPFIRFHPRFGVILLVAGACSSLLILLGSPWPSYGVAAFGLDLILAALAERGFTVVGVHLRGHGKNPRAARPFTFADLPKDVRSAVILWLSRAADEELLRVAQEQGRILVTRDRDFGALVFVELLGAGVLYLRVLPSTQNTVHGELGRVLATYSDEELASAFVTIEPVGHRIRRLPRK